MLAVKLHRKSRPWLGKGSHLVPILRWGPAQVQLKKWIRLLENGWRGPNRTIRHITLVRIPDEHPVSLHRHWWAKRFGRDGNLSAYIDDDGHAVYHSLRDIPQDVKQDIMSWSDHPRRGPTHPLPEIILGKPLSRSAILWTKSRLLLFRGDDRA